MGKKGKKSSGVRKPVIIEDNYVIESLADLNIQNMKNVILHNHYAQMLVVLIVVSFFLRFFNLTFNSLWLDEAATYDFAKLSLDELWETMVGGERNPPLFYYIEHILISLFGASEFVLRFVPALVGSLTIPVFYLIGREVLGRFGGIISAGLLTFSSYHIFYSQDARAYALVLFFFSIALLNYIYALKRGMIRYWVLCGIFCSLSFWTHMYVAIAIAALFLHAIIEKRKTLIKGIEDIKQVVAGLLAFVLPSLPLLIATLMLFLKQTSAGSPTWGLTGISIITTTITQFSGYLEYLAVIFVLIFIVGIVFLVINKEIRYFGLLAILSILISFIGTYVFSTMSSISPRHLIFILPFYFITIAAAFCLIPRTIDYQKVAVVLLIIICLLNLPYLSTYYTSYSKEDWRGMSDTLVNITDEGDYVVPVPSYMSLPLDYYYNSTADNTIEVGASSKDQLQDIENLRGDGQSSYYIVTWDIAAVDPSGATLNWLNENSVFLGQNTGIYLFKSI